MSISSEAAEQTAQSLITAIGQASRLTGLQRKIEPVLVVRYVKWIYCMPAYPTVKMIRTR